MKTLKSKFFQTLERDIALHDFENWLYSLDDVSDLMKEALWYDFFTFNYNSGDSNYEFSKLIRYFDINEYAIYKFENNLNQILQDRNLFRITKSCSDFHNRYDYSLFRHIAEFDDAMNNDFFSYDSVKSQLLTTAGHLMAQWEQLSTNAEKLAFLKEKIAVQAKHPVGEPEHFRPTGRWWRFWKKGIQA